MFLNDYDVAAAHHLPRAPHMTDHPGRSDVHTDYTPTNMSADQSFTLFYFDGFNGRAEAPILAFEDGGIPYTMSNSPPDAPHCFGALALRSGATCVASNVGRKAASADSAAPAPTTAPTAPKAPSWAHCGIRHA